MRFLETDILQKLTEICFWKVFFSLYTALNYSGKLIIFVVFIVPFNNFLSNNRFQLHWYPNQHPIMKKHDNVVDLRNLFNVTFGFDKLNWTCFRWFDSMKLYLLHKNFKRQPQPQAINWFKNFLFTFMHVDAK